MYHATHLTYPAFVEDLVVFCQSQIRKIAYVVRICPCGLHRTAAGSFWEFQPPCRAGHCAPTLQGSWPRLSLQPGDGCHWAHPPMSKINLRHRSPPCAQAGKGKIHFAKDFPSNNWNDSKPADLRQLPRASENANSAPRLQTRCEIK